MDWTDLVQFVQNPHESSVTHGYYLSLPKNRPKGAPEDTVTQSSLKKRDAFVLFGECTHGVRDDDHLISRSAVTLDFDQRDAGLLLKKLRIEAISVPFSYVWHTTRSHVYALDNIQPKVRVIIPLGRDVSPVEYRLLVRGLARYFPATLDPASLKPSQMMFCPIHNQDAPYRSGAFRTSGYVEPDSVLALIEDEPEARSDRGHDDRRRSAVQENGDVDPLVNSVQPLRGISLHEIERDLDRLDPDMEYDDWMTVIRAVHHQTLGSDEGLDLIDTWSQGGAKYEDGVVQAKWDELRHGTKGRATTYATILKWMNDQRAEKAVAVRDTFIVEIQNCTDERELEEKLARRISESDDLTPLGRKRLAEELVKRQKAVLGTALSIAEMRKAVSPASKSKTAVAVSQNTATLDQRFTEMGNAARLYDRIGHNLLFVPESQVWYRWQDGRWQEYPVEAVRRIAQQVIDDMPRNAPDDLSGGALVDYMSWCIKSQTSHMIDAMVKLLPGVPGSNMIVPGALMDSDMNLFGVRNGVIELDSGTLRDAERADLVTRVAACDYNPDAKCPLFLKVLGDAFFDDPKMIEWFHRVIGYSLLGNPAEQFFVIPYGLGSNGKSTILNAIRNVLGQHAMSTPYTTFLTDNKTQASASGPTEYLLRLKGSRFVYMSEPEAGMSLRASLIKSVTGGDELQARGVHARKSIAFKPSWVIFMPTNHRPVVKDDDHGIWRRIRLIPFTRNFDEDRHIEKDTALDDKLKAEYEGILAWCVAGASKYLRDRLGETPPSIAAAHASYRTDMDVLHDWLNDQWVTEPLGRTTMAELWGSWKRYAEQAGCLQMVPSEKSLGRRLLDRGFTQYRGTGGKRGYKGLIRRERSAEDEGFGK